MTLQNRVAPDGSLHAEPVRGTLTGNRGVLHDPQTRTLTGRRWTTRAWIACRLSWKGKWRPVWGRQIDGVRPGWTELFFLDEVTALAAGHRPCFACRRTDALAFLARARAGLGQSGLRAPELDARLHTERHLSRRAPTSAIAWDDVPALPDGAIVEAGGGFYALRDAMLLRWSHRGYAAPVRISEMRRAPVTLVTPSTVIAALRAGYRPAWHESAG